ncbi:MAG: protein translocase subunit SecF [Chloroflexi bacterium]|nr:MAG: protein translocase subunit SecF [Chloroflexota bacterium]TMB98007.1 MAG: protein translocase subunit SecF [Chloroflexota bacterium]TMC30735.1 MAG: protein translocase subunit SecF [Chloroflexota bacterium]TMC33440.1 MAG: protein translocase subunit SecF [Chloroflexota bacterium]TMC58922.1 MAG: protein translocase subunit SecF [Chloroflexota bacterium]
MIGVVERKWWYFLLSGLLIVPGVIFLALGGLKPGIEFRGGTLLELRFGQPPAVSDVRDAMAALDRPEAVVQVAEGGRIEVRTFEMKPDDIVKAEKALKDRYGANLIDLSSSVVSPSFSGELIQNAVRSIALASVLIVLLIAFAFRNFGWAAFRYGIAAIIALLHDAAVVLGIFAILGFFLGVEVDSLFVTAVLTIIGFSVHDTIVVFDRIRENLRLNPGEALNPVINFSIMQTLARSVITSLTVVLTLLALLLFGGFSMRNFALALVIGIVSGTYSSIFNASQIVSLWQELEDKIRHRATAVA